MENYFKVSERERLNLRKNLVICIFSSGRADYVDDITRDIVTLNILKVVRKMAIKKEDYEIIAAVDDIIKNKEFVIR